MSNQRRLIASESYAVVTKKERETEKKTKKMMNLIPNRIKLKMSEQHLIMIKIITDVEYLKAMRTLSYKHIVLCHF